MDIIIIAALIVVAVIVVKRWRKRRRQNAGTSNEPSRRNFYPPQPTQVTGQAANQAARQTANRTAGNDRSPGPMETEIMEYFANARRGQKDRWFRFRFRKVGNEWRAYIIRMPPLNGQSANCHLTHRYSDGNGNYWVCYDPKPTSLRESEIVSKAWADRYLEYTVTGVEANSQSW